MENLSRIFFSEIFIFRVVTQAILLENESIKNHEHQFSFWQFWCVTQNILLETHANQMLHIIYEFSQKIDMDEFSSKMFCVTAQNSPIDDWMSFEKSQNSRNST